VTDGSSGDLETYYHIVCVVSCCLYCGGGGVAQWLGRQSLAGELSLIYAWSMDDMWPLRG